MNVQNRQRTSPVRSAVAIRSLPKELMHPELMVIGDSLAQGCRSLTVNCKFCSQSWAARLAAAAGWRFQSPDFPQEILFDLESEIRQLGNFIDLTPPSVTFDFFVTRLINNLRTWLRNDQKSTALCFDNLGLAGAKISDLLTRSAQSSNDYLRKRFPNGATGPLLINVRDVPDIHIAINGRYTLNPSQNSAFDTFTPMGWVKHRLPQRLIIQIGHNHGLYAIGGDAQDTSYDGSDTYGKETVTYWSSFKKLARAVAGLPNEVSEILVMLLPKVGAVANLRPLGIERTNGYANAYEPVFATSDLILSGARLRQIDASVRDGNSRIRRLFQRLAPGRVKFFDTFEVFDRLDYKNLLDPARRIWVTKSQAIDNNYVSGHWHQNEVETGGFESVDGMHPTGCGYMLIAEMVASQQGWSGANKRALEQAFKEDQLLSKFPWKLDALVTLLRLIRGANRRRMLATRPLSTITSDMTHLPMLQAVELMKSVILR